MSNPGKLASLEAGRGVAALLVVTVHAWDHVIQAYPWFPFGALFAFGHAGVDFFFVLSGFVIMHVHARDIGQPDRLAHYAERRLTRIYPFYWATLALTVLATAAGSRPIPQASAVVASLLLLPVAAEPIISVAWTLQNEMLFYAIFAVLILNRRAGTLVLAAWFAALLGCTLAGLALPSVGGKLTSYFNFDFFFGLATAWLLHRATVPRPLTLLLVSAAVFLGIGLTEDTHLVRGLSILPHLGYGLASAGIVLGLVEVERQGRLTVPWMLTRLGSASYSIYLTHLLSIGAAWQALLACGLAAHLPGWAAFVILVTSGVLAGLVISDVLEKRITQLSRRLFARIRASQQTRIKPAIHSQGN